MMNMTKTLLAVTTSGILSLTGLAKADHVDWQFGLSIGNYAAPQRVWVEPVYETRCQRVWVEPVYQTACERVWHDAVIENRCERVYVPDRFEKREVRFVDSRGRIVVRCETVLVEPAHYVEVSHAVVVREAGWDDIQHQVLVREGCWNNVETRICVREGYWQEDGFCSTPDYYRSDSRVDMDLQLRRSAGDVHVGDLNRDAHRDDFRREDIRPDVTRRDDSHRDDPRRSSNASGDRGNRYR